MVLLCGWDWQCARGGEDGWILIQWAVVATSSRTHRTLTPKHYTFSNLKKNNAFAPYLSTIYLLEHGCKLFIKCIEARMWHRCKRFCNTHDCFKGGMNLEMASSFHLPRSNSTRDTLENTSSESSDNETTGKECMCMRVWKFLVKHSPKLGIFYVCLNT